MTDRLWEVTTSHAKKCDAGEKVYAYSGAGATIYVNSIFELVRVEFGGAECAPQQLTRPQRVSSHFFSACVPSSRTPAITVLKPR